MIKFLNLYWKTYFCQPGFRKLFFTNTAILDVSDYILEQLDNKKYVGAVSIDLKKAFDIVNYRTLLK